MKRTVAMNKAVAKPKQEKNSKFKVRKTHFKSVESPTIVSYTSPGRGPNGEHQN